MNFEIKIMDKKLFKPENNVCNFRSGYNFSFKNIKWIKISKN